MTYNGNKKKFAVAHVFLEFKLSGMVTKKIEVASVNLELNTDAWDTTRMVMELMVAISIVFTFLGEIKDLYEMRGLYFSSKWNYVDLLSICMYLLCGGCWLYLFILAQSVDVPVAFDLQTQEDQDKLVALSVTLDQAVESVQQYISYTTINIMVRSAVILFTKFSVVTLILKLNLIFLLVFY
eukprot:SAG11_NODE_1748_length_4320_cov_19.924899_2_plen_182_part_00